MFTDTITMSKALPVIGISKPTLLKWEKEYLEALGYEMPIPEDHLGYRRFSPKAIKWLQHVKELRQAGWDWLNINLELLAYRPQPYKTRANAPSASHFADVY